MNKIDPVVGDDLSNEHHEPSEASKANEWHEPEGIACMRRVERAISSRDLDALAQCFDPDYESEFPAHLDRAFRGHSAMRKNWSQIFAAVPDIEATLLRVVAQNTAEMVWTEWDWKGTRIDGAPYHMRGVTIQTIPAPEYRITRVSLYMEPVQEAGPGTDAAIRRSLTGPSD